MPKKQKKILGPRETELVAILTKAEPVNERVITTFASYVVSEADRALEGADEVFLAAARMRVFTQVVKSLTKPDGAATFDSIRLHAKRECFVWASQVSRQNGTVCYTMMRNCIADAWARLLEIMRSLSPDPELEPDPEPDRAPTRWTRRY